MAVEVRIPVAFKRFVDRKNFIECKPGTVFEILKEIGSKHPEFTKKIFDDKGNIKVYIDLLVDGQNIRNLQGIDTMVRDGQKITLFLAVAGG